MAKKRNIVARQQKQHAKAHRRSVRVQRRTAMHTARIDLEEHLLSDLEPYLAAAERGEEPDYPAKLVEHVLRDTAKWREEPEFDRVEISPSLAAELVMHFADERNLDPSIFFTPRGEEEEKLHVELMDAVSEKLVDRSVIAQIIEGLAELRKRFRRQRKRVEAAHAAFVQSLLQSDGDAVERSRETPLVSALVRRAIDQGFILMCVNYTADEEEANVRPLGDSKMTPKGLETILFLRKMEKVFPSLGRLMNRYRAQHPMEDEGEDAPNEALQLDLFTHIERALAREIILHAVELDEGVRDVRGQKYAEGLNKCMPALMAIILSCMTPERIIIWRDHLRIRLEDAQARDSAHAPRIAELYENLSSDEGFAREIPALTMLLIDEASDDEDDI